MKKLLVAILVVSLMISLNAFAEESLMELRRENFKKQERFLEWVKVLKLAGIDPSTAFYQEREVEVQEVRRRYHFTENKTGGKALRAKWIHAGLYTETDTIEVFDLYGEIDGYKMVKGLDREVYFFRKNPFLPDTEAWKEQWEWNEDSFGFNGVEFRGGSAAENQLAQQIISKLLDKAIELAKQVIEEKAKTR